MHKKLFLTSLTVMAIILPAFADDFPNDGLMQENTTYTNAATETNMDGVYEGTVNAEAQYEDKTYTVTAGNYLPMNSETLTPCPSGSFCDGSAGTVNYSTTTDQGKTACPTGYTSSDAGATSNEQCYRACTTQNANIAHATAVSGNDYYGNGTDTCAVTECEHGWHVEEGFNLATALGGASGDSYVNNDNSGDEYYNWGLSSEETGISGDPMAFVIEYKKYENKKYVNVGYVYGHGLCSTEAGQPSDYDYETGSPILPTTVSSLTDKTGQAGAVHCYCNISGYKAILDGTMLNLSSSWVYQGDYGDYYENCANDCPGSCARIIKNNDYEYRGVSQALYGSIAQSPATCEINTITINWTGASQSAINANNAGTATYGGDIRTPQSAEHVPGKTFTGWRFSKPSQQ